MKLAVEIFRKYLKLTEYQLVEVGYLNKKLSKFKEFEDFDLMSIEQYFNIEINFLVAFYC